MKLQMFCSSPTKLRYTKLRTVEWVKETVCLNKYFHSAAFFNGERVLSSEWAYDTLRSVS